MLRADNSMRKSAGLILSFWLIAAINGTPRNVRAVPLLESNYYCEANIANLDLAHSEAGESGLIIAVARLGDGERRRMLNHRRLHNLRTYLERFHKRARATIVTAEGERVTGSGRVEVYVGGRLFYVFDIDRGEDLHAGSCSATSKSDTLFYDSRTRTGRGEYTPASGY